MIKPEDLLTKLQDAIFSEDTDFDNHSDPFFDVTDLGRDTWINKTGWDPEKTNKPYPWEPGSYQGNVMEQDDKDKPKGKSEIPEPEVAPEPEEPEMNDVGDTRIGGAAGMGGMGMNAFGMPEEEPKEPKELGRTYELKKIYTRLVSIESYLSSSSDETLIKLRNYVSRAIELFQLLISNIDSYKDKIDDIIVTYYKFLELVYNLLKQYYKNKEKENNEE